MKFRPKIKGGRKKTTRTGDLPGRRPTVEILEARTLLSANTTNPNVAPVLAISGAPSADEGGEYTLNLASSDAGEDTIAHWTIDWGDGQIETVPGNPSSTTHVYADGPNTFNVSATATDEDGTHALLPGLVSRWTGDGHARDSTGAHDGALLYGVAFEEGKVNDAFSFDGLDDILVTPLTVSYGNGVTFEAWVKTTDQAALVLGDNSGISSESGMGLFMQPNGKVILFGGKGTYGESNFLVEGPVVNDNAYHHVAGTWTGDTAIDGVKLFVDGVLMGSTTALATISTGTATLHIGGYNVGQQNLAGLIDEPAVYNRGLSAAEIESIFHGGSDRVSVAVQNVVPEIFIGEFAGQLDDEGNFSANGFFVDPGSDTWSATVKYGDEGEEEPGLPLVLNPDKTFQLSHQYQFTQPDAFVVEVTIDDGDGGVTTKYGETLIVTGTLHNDDISIQFGSVIVTINGATIGTFPDHAVETVVVLGGDGNDNIQVEPAVTQSTELFGGSGNDTIVGGSGENVINGGEGNDTLTGGAGINTLFGGEGDDILQDGGGTNTVIGGAGDNTFVPGDGDNTVESEPGSTTPEVFADSYQITEDGQLSVAAALGVLANDVDPTATPLSATLATVPAHGVLSLQTDGSFIYEPDVDFIGVDHFTYIASNGTDISSGASVTVDIVKAVDDGEVTTDLEGIVRVGGTTGSDTVVVSQSPDGMNIEVTVNGRVRSVPLANVIEVRGWGREGDDRIDINGLAVKTRMFGGNGNDTIQVSGGLSVSNTFYGGAGNDRLRGGHGNDILFGGSGDDLILGKNGRDLLIGGVGADRIVGSADDDILIAGTAYLTVANTHAVMERWSGDEEIGVRQALVNDYIANNNLILAADDDRDVLTGSSGIDWFLANLGGDGVLDKITDLDDELFANDLDWILAG